MLKRDNIIRQLINSGYDEILVEQLLSAFLLDYFDKANEKISECLDIFIDEVQSGIITPDMNNNVNFGGIKKVKQTEESFGLYYEFRRHITEEFMQIIKRRPLRNILLENGALVDYDDGGFAFKYNVAAIAAAYNNICLVTPFSGGASIYVKAEDLNELLIKKGAIPSEIIWGEYGLGPNYPSVVPNEGIYMNYDNVLDIGKSSSQPRPGII